MKRWLWVIGGIYAYDVLCANTGESLSALAERLDDRPVARLAAIGAWLYLGDHLFGTRKLPFVPLVKVPRP